ncbi:UDP-2,3-diacylglucosamine diphosphatase LpxI [Rickettsiales bacterium]|nr:UDP-2,3-diacylglucosamine diphosphatase LpxI [Rickettsiales bacterium]
MSTEGFSEKMSAQKKVEISPLGIIAGDGSLPDRLITGCMNLQRDVFVINIDTNKNPSDSLHKVPHITLGISSVGKAVKTLKERNIQEIIFAGSVKRPKLSSLRPDAGGIKLLTKISTAKLGGDNSLLSIVVKHFEDQGFKVVGVDDVLKDLLMPKGAIGNIEPDEEMLNNIKFGKTAIKKIGELDIGQSIVVQQNIVLGVEAIEGTDALIKRCGGLQLEGAKPVLVKMKKPTQDPRIDLPTIGLKTLRNCHEAGFAGIAVEAGGALVLDKEKMIEKANQMGLFIVGI